MSAIGITRSERTLSGALALGMHVLFALLLVVGVTWQQRRSDAPVAVDLWSNLPPQPQPKVEPPPPQVKPEPEPPKPAPRAEPKPAPKPEPKPVVKPDIALKEKLEKERKLKEQQEAKKREDEKKLAALKQEKLEKERLRKEQEVALQKMLAEKQAQDARAAAQSKLMDAYMNSVRNKIRPFVPVELPGLQGNPEVQFDVVQLPGGEVLSVKLKRSSGVPAYDSAVERAILRAQPLPPPPAGVTFAEVRELNLKFRPKE